MQKLTDTADELIAQTDRKAYLKEKVLEINKHLPAAVYIPFVTGSIRNYTILSIRMEEAYIFKTKERCPVLMVFEAFRPTELFLDSIPEPVQYLQYWLNKKHSQEQRK
jgi:hypothetical protein